MVSKLLMLDTNICSYIIRERPPQVLTQLHAAVQSKHRIVVSAITYAELVYGANHSKASPKLVHVVDEFVQRLDEILPWDKRAVDETARIKKTLEQKGTPIGSNDCAIAGHAISVNAILVSNNTSEFKRVKQLALQNWV